jgi:tetratricopeptide (TPR) repeat protein
MADHVQNEIEIEDAKAVDRAIEALRHLDLHQAERLLQVVLARTPAHYVNELEQDGTRYIKFWDLEEYVAYAAVLGLGDISNSSQVVWLPNAYPRAHFQMAFVCVERQQWEDALRWLDAGTILEPGQPRFSLEKAVVLNKLGRHTEALSMYDRVLEDRTVLPPSMRAVALRGRGFQLIELGKLDEAERSLLESLEIEPDNTLARNELVYIQHLRSGGEVAPQEMAWPKGLGGRCAVCGVEVLLSAEDSGDKRICESCRLGGGAVLGCGCIANQVLCDGFAVVVVKHPCSAHFADKDVIQQLLPPDPDPTSLAHAALHAIYFAKTEGRQSGPPLRYADKILRGLVSDPHGLLTRYKHDVGHAALAAMAGNIARRGNR